MKIKQYDNVELIDGRKATIVEILGDNDEYIADIEIDDNYDTDIIYPKQIAKVIN